MHNCCVRPKRLIRVQTPFLADDVSYHVHKLPSFSYSFVDMFHPRQLFLYHDSQMLHLIGVFKLFPIEVISACTVRPAESGSIQFKPIQSSLLSFLLSFASDNIESRRQPF
jgi:hypothetical protein